MGDYADHTIAVSQPLERVDDDVQRLWVEGTESFVDEDGVESSRGCPGQLAQPDRQRQREAQRRQEGLATRECRDAPSLVGVAVIDHVEAAGVGDEAIAV